VKVISFHNFDFFYFEKPKNFMYNLFVTPYCKKQLLRKTLI